MVCTCTVTVQNKPILGTEEIFWEMNFVPLLCDIGSVFLFMVNGLILSLTHSAFIQHATFNQALPSFTTLKFCLCKMLF